VPTPGAKKTWGIDHADINTNTNTGNRGGATDATNIRGCATRHGDGSAEAHHRAAQSATVRAVVNPGGARMDSELTPYDMYGNDMRLTDSFGTPTGDIATERIRISPDIVLLRMSDDVCIWIHSRTTSGAIPIERDELRPLIARLTEIANREDEQGEQ
jgi:hypothetical protein